MDRPREPDSETGSYAPSLLPEGFRSMIRTIRTDSRLHNLLLVLANPKEIICVQTDPLGYN